MSLAMRTFFKPIPVDVITGNIFVQNLVASPPLSRSSLPLADMLDINDFPRAYQPRVQRWVRVFSLSL
jgi:hypothetical protein